MTHITKHIKILLALVVVLSSFTSCYDFDNNREICDYKVQLRYDYNEENGTTQNMIEQYVFTIDEYIFGDDNKLYQKRRFTADRCTEHMNSELNLPPGKYSVIAIGNQDDRSVATDKLNQSEPTVGVTHRDDMLLALENPEHYGGSCGESERLYHGYKTFTVKERGISRVRVDMINAHMTLRFRITWKNNTAPARGNYYALLETVPSQYSLMPEFIYPIGSFDVANHDCDGHDGYPSDCNNVIHHIPLTCYSKTAAPEMELCHRHNTYLNADKEMWGEFVSYRIKNATPVVLRIHSTADDSRTLPSDIDVRAYLNHELENRDHTLRQDYALDIVIEGTKITIVPLDIADWDEGGMLGGK